MFSPVAQSRTPRLPELKTFQDLFLEYVPHKDLNPGKIKEVLLDQKESWFKEKGKRSYPCYLSGYISVRFQDGTCEHWKALQVAPCIKRFFQEHVLGVESDRLYFQITEHRDGTAGVSLQHNQIIGSHYLAEIDTASIPRFGVDE